ncbi:MAG: hypothetical protein MK130_10225 [Puniceicoccaceae bacterium]|nr:hypothetical protein [Puniceicoccaceae bacterium]
MTTNRLPYRLVHSGQSAEPSLKEQPQQAEVSIERWKGSRHWAVFVDGKLLALAVYKKGALAIRERILR